MMRKTTLSRLSLILLISCSTSNNTSDIDGYWVIFEMSYKKDKIYPNDFTPNKLSFDITGYEGSEKFRFHPEDSTVIAPGFNSEEMALKYMSVGVDSITISYDEAILDNYKTEFLNLLYQDTSILSLSNDKLSIDKLLDSLNTIKNETILNRGSKSLQYGLTKKIYCGKYLISINERNGQLSLKSNETSIIAVSKAYLADNRIDKLFKGL